MAKLIKDLNSFEDRKEILGQELNHSKYSKTTDVVGSGYMGYRTKQLQRW